MRDAIFTACTIVALWSGLVCLAVLQPSDPPPSPQEILYDEARELLSGYFDKHQAFPQSL